MSNLIKEGTILYYIVFITLFFLTCKQTFRKLIFNLYYKIGIISYEIKIYIKYQFFAYYD